MEQVRELVKDHLEKHKFFDSLKSAVSKDPKLMKLDRQQIIEKLRSEGMLNEIIASLPVNKKSSVQKAQISQVIATKRPKEIIDQGLDPNKRYLSCSVVKGSAFVDFVNVRTDESVSIAISFLKNRYHTKQVLCSTDPVFDESFLFEFVGDNEQIKFDAATLLKLN